MTTRYSDKVVAATKNLPVPETVYDAPKDTFTNQFSGINTGISQQGGLASLSFKSVEYTQLIEQIEMLRDALLDEGTSGPLRVNENVFQAADFVVSLKKDIEDLKKWKPSGSKEGEEVTKLNAKLDDLISGRADIASDGQKLREELTPSGHNLLSNPPQYIKPNLKIGMDVQKMADVADLDRSAYEKEEAEADDSYAEGEDVEMTE